MSQVYTNPMPNPADAEYNKLVQHIAEHGIESTDRTGSVSKSVFGYQLRYTLSRGSFPLLTTKKMPFDIILNELLWFLSGSTNDNDLKRLNDNHRDTIWTANANAPYWKPKAKSDGDLGKIYGYNWRTWQGHDGTVHDQIAKLERDLTTNPESRRHVVSAWNPTVLDEQALPACHTLFQVYVRNDTLSLHMYQRSADVGLGLPFNIASYAILANMLAETHGFALGDLIISLGDAHIYEPHYEPLVEQITRIPAYSPRLLIENVKDSILDYQASDFVLVDYHSHPAIKMPMMV